MSLSNVLKSASSGEKRIIETKVPIFRPNENETETEISPEDMAQQILQNARVESEKIRKEIEFEKETTLRALENERKLWETEREEERRKTQEEGFNEGFAKGTDEVRAAWNDTLEQAKEIVAAAESDYKDYLAQSEEDILKLSVAIAGRIISEVLEKEPDNWLSIVKNAIKEVRDQDTIKIMVSPSRYTEMLEKKAEIQTVSRDARLQIFPEETLSENDCFIETPYGRIDASVDRQLQVIKLALKEMLEAGIDEGQRAD